jgi:hypothetical protein
MLKRIGNAIKYSLFPHKLEAVFTPTTAAHLTYIERKEIEKDFEKHLLMPGMQIVIYGNSGSGKTTLVTNILQKLNIRSIKTSCTESTTYEQLILDAFDRLGKYYISEKNSKKINSVNQEYGAKYYEIASSMKTSDTSEMSETKIRVVPIQLTAQRLAEFLGIAEYVWIIEDFHKVIEEDKKKLAQVLKVFMDCSNEHRKVKIICIGAVGTARELIQYDKELTNRVAEIFVPLMNTDELKAIVNKGFRLINVSGNNEDMIPRICYYSNGLASVCHQLCYDLCYNSDLKKSQVIHKQFDENDFKNAVKSYIAKESDTFMKNYEKACTIVRCKTLLKEIIERDGEYFDPSTDTNGSNISENKATEKRKIFSLLVTPEYGELFRINQYSGQYIFSSPFFRTFLKMKFALDKAEQESREKGNKFPLYELTQRDNVFMNYFDIMDANIDWRNEIVQIIDNKMPPAQSVISTLMQNRADIKKSNYEVKSRIRQINKVRRR